MSVDHHDNGQSVIERLAAYACGESFSVLPEATVQAARRAILDTLGVTLAGSQEETAERARALIAHRGGSDEATIIGTALRGSVEDAALANGTAAHALDYDDVNASLSGHPSVPVLSAAFALGERERASGQSLVAAFVAGVEIEAKLGRALNPAHYEAGWHATSTLGVFGAAAAAAKLLDLSVERTAHALAIAASMASGIKANFGTDCKPLHAGHAARCGVEAAFLAAAGFTGNPRALEHVDGFGSTHGAGSKPAWELATSSLGTPHEVVEPGIGVKRFPCCASTHQALDATLQLVEEHAIDPAAVAGVECAVHYLAPHQLIYERAETGLQGKFSMAYCVAVALLDRTVGLAQFSDERVRRPDVQALMPRVRMFVHPEQTTRDCLPRRFSEVTVTLADGRRLERRVRHAKGQPQNPLADTDLEIKFRDCAARALAPESVELLLSAMGTLETAADVGQIARLLGGGR
ncbi:MAG TPA: MmgE/PrpD family protein [Methylomirabilota bacterium]|jgi:2-methylcitrate dehydratase PrpD|nr:MmgE/PrpD family protein [Methylomirabilota bacterium]